MAIKPISSPASKSESQSNKNEFLAIEGIQDKLNSMSINFGVSVDEILELINKETGGSFSPSQKNFGGGQATGLIQFLGDNLGGVTQSYKTISGKKYEISDIGKMDELTQLDLVEKFLQEGLNNSGQTKYVPGELSLAVAVPAFIGKDDEWIANWAKNNPETYKKFMKNNPGWVKDGVMNKTSITDFYTKDLNLPTAGPDAGTGLINNAGVNRKETDEYPSKMDVNVSKEDSAGSVPFSQQNPNINIDFSPSANAKKKIEGYQSIFPTFNNVTSPELSSTKLLGKDVGTENYENFYRKDPSLPSSKIGQLDEKERNLLRERIIEGTAAFYREFGNQDSSVLSRVFDKNTLGNLTTGDPRSFNKNKNLLKDKYFNYLKDNNYISTSRANLATVSVNNVQNVKDSRILITEFNNILTDKGFANTIKAEVGDDNFIDSNVTNMLQTLSNEKKGRAALGPGDDALKQQGNTLTQIINSIGVDEEANAFYANAFANDPILKDLTEVNKDGTVIIKSDIKNRLNSSENKEKLNSLFQTFKDKQGARLDKSIEGGLDSMANTATDDAGNLISRGAQLDIDYVRGVQDGSISVYDPDTYNAIMEMNPDQPLSIYEGSTTEGKFMLDPQGNRVRVMPGMDKANLTPIMGNEIIKGKDVTTQIQVGRENVASPDNRFEQVPQETPITLNAIDTPQLKGEENKLEMPESTLPPEGPPKKGINAMKLAQGALTLLKAGMGISNLSKGMKEIPVERMPELDSAWKGYMIKMKEMSNSGLTGEEKASAKQDLSTAYNLGIKNIMRASGGSRASFLANTGVLNANRVKGLLKLSGMDAATQRDNLKQYGAALQFQNKSKAVKGQIDSQMAYNEAKRTRDIRSTIGSSLIGSALDDIHYYSGREKNNDLLASYEGLLKTQKDTNEAIREKDEQLLNYQKQLGIN